jgi:hypothetical protein
MWYEEKVCCHLEEENAMETRVGDDLLWGVRQIAEELGMKERQVYYQLEKGLLPGGKSGEIWVGSRQALKAHFQELTATRHTKTVSE